MTKQLILILSVLTCLLGQQMESSAATVVYLQVDGIPGESAASGFENQIELLNWSWGLSNSNPGDPHSQPQFFDLSVSKYLDKSSPPLMLKAADGTPINKVVLTVALIMGSEKPLKLLIITLSNVAVSSAQISGDSERPVEQYSFTFTKIKVEYDNGEDRTMFEKDITPTS